MKISGFAIVAGLTFLPAGMNAQFSVNGKPVQVHGFVQQGYAYSGTNNYLTMRTNGGSFAFTDGGLNISTRLTDRFRVGAQGYIRNIGELGNGRVELDWAFGDYKFSDRFGVRAGKVKTALGLYNDTQDMEFLHTWAILPQSLYPLDLRASNIAHTGGDVYGEVSLRKAGSISYTGYFGLRSDDPRGGFSYGTADNGVPIRNFTGNMGGADVRWNTAVPGLMLGYSFMKQNFDIEGTLNAYAGAPFGVKAKPQRINSAYVDYVKDKLHLSGEFRRNYQWLEENVLGRITMTNASDKAWFASAAYRLLPRLELGTYHSRYNVDKPRSRNPAATHIFDQVFTARVDINKMWNIKAEGHMMDGFGDTYSARGFYIRSNRGGLARKTNMLVFRTGINF